MGVRTSFLVGFLLLLFGLQTGASAQNLNRCIRIEQSIAPNSATLRRVVFTNTCDRCVSFKPLAVGLAGSNDIYMSNLRVLGSPVFTVELNPGQAQTLFWGTERFQGGAWQASALDREEC